VATQNQSIERHYPAISICPLKVTGGIYGIINNSSGKIYVGSAVSFRKRWNGHKHFFRRGIQENQYLQRAFDKKPHEFEIFIIEELKNLSKKICFLENNSGWIFTNHIFLLMDIIYHLKPVRVLE